MPPVALLAWLAAVGFVAGLARGFSGFGSALIFVPLASIAVGPRVAAPILMIIDVLGSLPMLPAAWRDADRNAVFLMSAGTVAGIPLGTWVLTHADPGSVRWGLSLGILLLVGGLSAGWRYHGQPWRVVTTVVGALSGFLTGVAQIGGSVAVAYWLSGMSEANRIRANMVLFLALSQVFAVGAYGVSGLFTRDVAVLALAAGPAFLAGVAIGSRMFGLASALTFRRLCFALIVLAAVGSLPLFS